MEEESVEMSQSSLQMTLKIMKIVKFDSAVNTNETETNTSNCPEDSSLINTTILRRSSTEQPPMSEQQQGGNMINNVISETQSDPQNNTSQQQIVQQEVVEQTNIDISSISQYDEARKSASSLEQTQEEAVDNLLKDQWMHSMNDEQIGGCSSENVSIEELQRAVASINIGARNTSDSNIEESRAYKNRRSSRTVKPVN